MHPLIHLQELQLVVMDVVEDVELTITVQELVEEELDSSMLNLLPIQIRQCSL